MDEANPFIDWLLETLSNRGITRQELSRRMGLKNSAPLTNIINRDRNLGVKNAKRIADALGIDQAEIFRIAQLQDDEPDAAIDPITSMAIGVMKQLPLEERELMLDYAHMLQRRNERKKQKLARALGNKS